MPKKEKVITEEVLQKALDELAGKKEGDDDEDELDPKVLVTRLEKTVRDTIEEMGSPELKKAMDVSEVLDEAIALMGLHLDRSLARLEKSIDAAAQRDQAIVTIMGDMRKAIDDGNVLTLKLLDQPDPSKAAKNTNVTVTAEDVLKKGLDDTKSTQAANDPKVLRKTIAGGLEKMVQTAGIKTQEGQRLSQVVVKFESTGEISDSDVTAALKAAKS